MPQRYDAVGIIATATQRAGAVPQAVAGRHGSCACASHQLGTERADEQVDVLRPQPQRLTTTDSEPQNWFSS
jgi:hypothetical protein